MTYKRIYVEIMKLPIMVKLLFIATGILSLVSVVHLFIEDTSLKTIISGITFTSVLQLVNAYMLLALLSKQSKKDTSDKLLRKDIFNRISKLENNLETLERKVLEIEITKNIKKKSI